LTPTSALVRLLILFSANVALTVWAHARRWTLCAGDRRQELVFIGIGIDHDKISQYAVAHSHHASDVDRITICLLVDIFMKRF
jgi:hypothetical protein